MKQFELTLVVLNKDFDIEAKPGARPMIQSIDKIEANDLVHLLSQFTFVLLNIQRKIYEDEIGNIRIDDDISF